MLWQYYSVMVPVAYTYYLGPVLTLSAAMFALTMMNKNNELLPLKCSGVSIYRIVAPIFLMGSFFAIATFLSQQVMIPSMKDEIREVYAYARRKVFRESDFIEDAELTRFTVGTYWPVEKRAERVIVAYREYSPHAGRVMETRKFVADVLQWEANDALPTGGLWVLTMGKGKVREYRYDALGEMVRLEEESLWKEYERHPLATDLIPEDFEDEGGNAQYLALRDLTRQWQRRPYCNAILVKIHQHWSFPLTHVVLLLLGLPFVLNQNNRSVFLGVLVSVVICVLYYIVNAMCVELGTKGTLQPAVSAWLPVLLFTGIGVTLFDNVRT